MNDTSTAKLGEAYSNDRKPGSHYIVGVFLGTYSIGFLLLIAIRIRRLILQRSKDVIADFMHQHVPEQNHQFLHILSKGLVFATSFGMIYSGLGARYLNHDLHPDWGFFHYKTHLTLIFLFLFAGFAGVLESHGYLPKDSLRASFTVGLWGEALLWYDHALMKEVLIDMRLHEYLALTCAFPALVMTISLILTTMKSSNVTLSFLVFLGSNLALLWHSIWFITVGVHLSGMPIPNTGTATDLLVIQAVLLIFGCQVVSALMVRLQRRINPQSAQESYALVSVSGKADEDEETAEQQSSGFS
ncbi:expressed unknown protein [Seminavis robusta]|uniref:Uncharacterized protein n=1 Tax=Seminavis robusta TaxID=568900 RepID=A0A9N8HXZ2_9STRA|nr:expressed unknown protein [Seminavis robusta]|eukprot:Sro2631_g333210.1 n/a (301) ;mRNA; f:11773-12675